MKKHIAIESGVVETTVKEPNKLWYAGLWLRHMFTGCPDTFIIKKFPVNVTFKSQVDICACGRVYSHYYSIRHRIAEKLLDNGFRIIF